MRRVIGLDFDGTLLDSRARHAAALSQAARELGLVLPDGLPERFVAEKSNGSPGVEVLARHQIARARDLAGRWTVIVEDLELQALDRLYPDVLPCLTEGRRHECRYVVATARQNPAAAVGQAERLGLRLLVEDFIVVDPLRAGVGRRKAEATQHFGLSLIVGDTESDLQWARCLDTRFCALARGFRSDVFWRTLDVEPRPDLATALQLPGFYQTTA